MAAIIATIKGKVLIQLPGSEPVEVGELEFPIHASTSAMPKTRGRELTIATKTVHVDHTCEPCTVCDHADHCSLNCPVEGEINRARAGEQVVISGVTRKAAVDSFRKLAERAGDDATVSIANGAERIVYPSGGSIRVRGVGDRGFDQP